MTRFAELAERLVRAPLRQLLAAPPTAPVPTVRDAIVATHPDIAVEVTLWRDGDGVWVAHPVGGSWPHGLTTDNLPIATGPDPVQVLAELLDMPARVPTPCTDCGAPTETGICPQCLEERR